jgi:hypothetical protein
MHKIIICLFEQIQQRNLDDISQLYFMTKWFNKFI